jgi:type IV pilus biogenesis protein CpaD/CtpE
LFEGDELAGYILRASDIERRVLNLAVPKGSMTAAQRTAIEAAQLRAEGLGVNFVLTPF